MKKNLTISLLLVTIFAITSCQKKFATFQKSHSDSYVQSVEKGKFTQSSDEIETKITNPLNNQTELASNDDVISSVIIAEKPIQSSDLRLREKEIDAEFEKLNELEKYIQKNTNTTIADVKDTKLTEGLNLDTNIMAALKPEGDLPMNIPPFVWGCCLSFVGVIIVYVTTKEDKDQTKKALLGCVVGAVGCVGVYFAYALLGGGYYY